MRILIVGTTYYPFLNGQAIFTTNLAEGLAKHGHEVMVLHPRGHSLSTERNGVQIEIIGSVSLARIHPDTFVPVIFGDKVHCVFDTFKPQIVHIQDHYPLSRQVMKEAFKRGVKIIGTNHFSPENLTPYLPGSRLFKSFYDRFLWAWMMKTYNRLDAVTAPSQTAVDRMRQNGLSKSASPVSCGTDLNRFHPDPSIDLVACRSSYGLDPAKMIFLYVGRIDEEKKIDILLHAIHKVQRNDIQLAIAGDGAAIHELLSLARKLNLGNRIRFTEYVRNEDLYILLNSVDVFAMASETESFSIASLEAMACGLPILAANSSALPDLVEAGVNGYLFRPGDAGDAARYMNVFADQRGRLKEMGMSSLAKAKRHSLENTVQKYESLYESLLDPGMQI